MDPTTAIGIDVGGTKIAAGLVPLPEGRVLARSITPTQPQRGGRAVLDDVLALARQLQDQATRSGHPAAVIGLGVCELVDLAGRVASANCIDWLDLPVLDELSAIAPTAIEADVRAAALAESLWGAGRGADPFLYITVGTGIACCLVVGGRPFTGARGATGTMASTPFESACERCGHTASRSLEEIASGPALLDRFRALHGRADSGADVTAAAAAGDPVASKVVSTAAQALGRQIGLLVNVLDPAAVVIGGGLGLAGGPFWDELVSATRSHTWSPLHRDIPISRAATGADAGWLGAAAHAAAVLSPNYQPRPTR
jgi:glucokinase